MTPTPPRSAVWLLRTCLGQTAFEIVAGDLDEEFFRGRRAAWYWRQVLRSILARWVGLVPTAGEVVIVAMRQLRRQPLYVVAVAGTLALAVSTALASAAVVKRAFVDALPYPHADRLVSLLTVMDARTSPLSAAVLRDLLEGSTPFDLVAPIRPTSPTLTTDDAATPVGANLVTPEYFELVGVRPALGRLWSDPADRAVVVSWRFYQATLGGRPDAVGRTITLDGTPRTVIGVLPEGFFAPYWPLTAIWAPLDLTSLQNEPRGRRSVTTLARWRADQSAPQVDAFMSPFSTRLQVAHPVEHGQQSWIARPLRAEFTGTSRPALIGLAAGAVLLLLIVCANVAGLSAARGLALQHQLAVRQAMGAGRGRLFGEQLAHSLCLAAIGSGAGALLAPLLVAVAARYQGEYLDRLAPITLDATTLIVGLGLGLVSGAIAALVPVRLLGPVRLDDVLRSARGTTGGRRLTVARQGLVVAQVALALVLVVGAGLLVRTVAHLTTLNLGFTTEGMTALLVNMPGARYASQARQVQLEDDLVARLRAIPGVDAVTASVGLPVGAAMGASLHIEGRPATSGLSEVVYFSVAPDFMQVMGIPLRAGRPIADTDTAGRAGAILISESMARLHWPDGDAIGSRIYLGPGTPPGDDWMSVVGVVGDVRQHGPTQVVRPTAYGSTRQYSWPRRHLTIRAPRAGATLHADIRAAVRAADPGLSIGMLRSLPEWVESQGRRHQLVMLVLLVFGGVSLVLCGSGLYAVVAMASRLRRREYAIRVALGARREHVRWQVTRHAVWLAGGGIALGLVLAAVGVGTVRGLLHGVVPLDLGTFAFATLLLATLAAGAAWWPARQAARVNPVEALKSE